MNRKTSGFIRLVIFAIIVGVVFGCTFDFLQAKRAEKSPFIQFQRKDEQSQQSPSQDKDDEQVDKAKEQGQGSHDSSLRDQLITEPSVDTKRLEQTINAVFSVHVLKQYPGYGLQPISSGSSVLYKEDESSYYFMTNAHVINNGDVVNVQVDDKDIEVKVVGFDTDTDLAVFKANKADIPKTLIPAKLANSDDVKVLDPVLAVGNALGWGKSITKGIISALERSLSGKTDFAYKLIQTDAAINPGNSGGALINLEGEVVGINSIKITDRGGIRVEGFGFAIPIDAATKICDSLIEYGYLPKTFLGVVTRSFGTDEYGFDSGRIKGLLVVQVIPGSGADEAGVKVNDLIVAVDEIPIEKSLDLSNYIKSKEPGDRVILKIVRGNDFIDLSPTLQETKK